MTAKLCALCRKKPAVFDSPVACSGCFLTLMGLLGSITQKRLETEPVDADSHDA